MGSPPVGSRRTDVPAICGACVNQSVTVSGLAFTVSSFFGDDSFSAR